MRLLGVDFGFARIGIAVAETEPFAIGVRPTISASGKLQTDAVAIAERAKKEEVSSVVLGLPLDEDGAEGRMARITRQLAGHLENLGWTPHLVDERYTSVESEQLMTEAGLKGSQKRKAKDGEAAARILERYISSSESN